MASRSVTSECQAIVRNCPDTVGRYLISDEAKRVSPEKVATIAERVEKVRAALPPDAKDLPLGYVDISGYFIVCVSMPLT